MIRAAAPTILPKAPAIVLGVLDLQGEVIPLFDVRSRFGLPRREIRPEDQFVIARARGLTVGLVVDTTEGVFPEDPKESVSPERVVPGLEKVRGITRIGEGLVLIHDLGTFLSLEEEASLRDALAPPVGG